MSNLKESIFISLTISAIIFLLSILNYYNELYGLAFILIPSYFISKGCAEILIMNRLALLLISKEGSALEEFLKKRSIFRSTIAFVIVVISFQVISINIRIAYEEAGKLETVILYYSIMLIATIILSKYIFYISKGSRAFKSIVNERASPIILKYVMVFVVTFALTIIFSVSKSLLDIKADNYDFISISNFDDYVAENKIEHSKESVVVNTVTNAIFFKSILNYALANEIMNIFSETHKETVVVAKSLTYLFMNILGYYLTTFFMCLISASIIILKKE